MSEHTKDMLRRYYEIWSTGDLSAVDELLHPEFIDHTSGPEPIHGTEAFKEFVRSERAGLPDIVETPVALLADDEWAAGLYRERGTHQGEFMKLPPTGEVVDFTAMEIFRLRDGKFAEWWYSNMWLETYRQLGWHLEVTEGVPNFRRKGD